MPNKMTKILQFLLWPSSPSWIWPEVDFTHSAAFETHRCISPWAVVQHTRRNLPPSRPGLSQKQRTKFQQHRSLWCMLGYWWFNKFFSAIIYYYLCGICWPHFWKSTGWNYTKFVNAKSNHRRSMVNVF